MAATSDRLVFESRDSKLLMKNNGGSHLVQVSGTIKIWCQSASHEQRCWYKIMVPVSLAENLGCLMCWTRF